MSSQREGRGRTWECCKEVSHRLWTETYYGDGYRSGCPDNGGEMGSLSIVNELLLFRGYLTFRHIFTWRDLNWWHTQTKRRRYAMSIKSTVSRGWNGTTDPFHLFWRAHNNFMHISKTFTPLVDYNIWGSHNKKDTQNLKCFVLLVIRLDLNFIKKRQMVKTNAAYISCHVSQYAVDSCKIKFKCQPTNGPTNWPVNELEIDSLNQLPWARHNLLPCDSVNRFEYLSNFSKGRPFW